MMTRRDRGSAMILCLLLAVAATTAVLAITSLATNCAKEQTSREYNLKVKMSIEGVLAKVEQSFGDGTIQLGVPTVITCGGMSWNTTTVDYSATKAKSYQVTIAGTVSGKAYSRKYVIGNPYALATFKFAVSRNANLSLSDTFGTGPVGKGDVFVDGTVLLGIFGTVDGDYYTTALIAPIGLIVKGKTVTGAKPISFPALNSAAYSAAADRTVGASAGTTQNWTFLSPNEVVYIPGDLKLKGTITGSGTIYVDGNLTIQGDTAYGDVNSLVVFLVKGNAGFAAGTHNVVGHFYVANVLSVNVGLLQALTLSGSMVGNTGLNLVSKLTVTFDPRIKNDQKLGYALKLPGYWP